MKLITIISVIFLFSGCAKDNIGRVPDVLVDYRVTLQEFGIKNQNQILLVDGHGVAGLLIYKNGAVYTAYDRCSTVNPEKRCPVIPDDNGVSVTDTCSGGKFSLYDGAPVKAPATRNLKRYDLIILNNAIIQVSN